MTDKPISDTLYCKNMNQLVIRSISPDDRNKQRKTPSSRLSKNVAGNTTIKEKPTCCGHGDAKHKSQSALKKKIKLSISQQRELQAQKEQEELLKNFDEIPAQIKEIMEEMNKLDVKDDQLRDGNNESVQHQINMDNIRNITKPVK